MVSAQGGFAPWSSSTYIHQEELMEEHLTAGQIAEFTLGCLDEDEIEGVYRHFDECGEGVSWLAGVVRVAACE